MTPDDWRREGERLLSQGAPILAYDALADGLAAHPGDVRLRQLLALALARSGAARQAIPILDQLRAEGHADEETLGVLARAHKDLSQLDLAYQFYAEAYRVSGGIWSGINAATVALLLGRRDEAERLASAVRATCEARVGTDGTGASSYWDLATLGEAQLILGERAEAEQAYARAAEIGRSRAADTASTRRNARLIVRALGIDSSGIERALRVPRVIAFAGHLIDRPDRATPRFPPALERAAADAIAERLRRLEAGFGYSSAASGADILFLEALAGMNGETTIVLPYGRDEFEKDSVDLVPGGDWPRRYQQALARANDVVTASEHRMGGGELSYEYAVTLIEGLAGLRADELDTEIVPLVLWDGRESGGRGGTTETVERWRRSGPAVEIIDLAALAQQAGIRTAPAAPSSPPSPPFGISSSALRATADKRAAGGKSASRFESQIVTMLFADARGFSGLSEQQIPAFVERFLGMVADRMARASCPPVLKNTWGDGLYFVFAHARDAGLLALDLADAIAATDWSVWGLPPGMSLRTGLHAGPAYACSDPITGRPNYLGAHVSRAARIEPITPPGAVYASREFAAVARAEHVAEFRCEYVGRTALAKGFGTAPMYVVRRERLAAGCRSAR